MCCIVMGIHLVNQFSFAESCPANHTCRCDSLTSDLFKEGGLVTSKHLLPVSEVIYGGVSAPNMEGYVKIGPVRCGPTPFGKKSAHTEFSQNMSHYLKLTVFVFG